MRFPTIRIEGSILSADILDKLEKADLRGQRPTDFGLPTNAKVKDEIVQAWTDAQGLWRMFKRQMENVALDKSGTTETRRYWMVPLLGLLGYNPELMRDTPRIDDKTYPISHADASRSNLPLHIMGFHDSLDKKRETGGPRLSPHALVQEYINLHEHLYGLVTNGLRLRLLRDSSRLVRLSFVEFDLERIFDEDHFADFAVLYRLLHASRMPAAEAEGASSLIEHYHQEALESGSRIREGLSNAVYHCLNAFGTGFLQHPDNAALRELIEQEKLSPKQYHHALLRLIYRLLFLLVTEERHLLFPALPVPADEAARKAATTQQAHEQVYQQYYSLARLRRLCEQSHVSHDTRFADLWQGLMRTFRLFESESQGAPLSIKPLAGELFSSRALSSLPECQLANHVLLSCIKSLNEFRNPNTNQTTRVNYGALDVEEFGSVYEGLLDYNAVITQGPGRWSYSLQAGSDRASSGSHYTPEQLVQPLIRHSLEHVIADKLTTAKAAAQAATTTTLPTRGGDTPAVKQAIADAQAAALLSVRVCDVACGSGHMLLSAARRLAVEIARVRTQEDQPSPTAQRQAMRDVISQCIYGVDYNPLAVELCKVALWLEAHNPGEPLNFLDHHIRCGNAIVGLAHAEDLERGIADEAFKKLPNDDKATSAALRKRNKAEKTIPNQTNLFHEATDGDLSNLGRAAEQVRRMPDHSTAEIEAKAAAYHRLTRGAARHRIEQLANLQVAPFFIPKTLATADHVLTDAAYRRHLTGNHAIQDPSVAYATEVAVEERFFHWFLEFPDVMAANGGFNLIIGNPPFLGGLKISTKYGLSILNWLHFNYSPAGGTADLVTYFFRRAYSLLNPSGFLALISTNTIAQGDTKEGGLDIITNHEHKGAINFAVRSMKWPGMADVDVSLICVSKNGFIGKKYLDEKEVVNINNYLGIDEISEKHHLEQNNEKSFIGTLLNGAGFILSEERAKLLINQNAKNALVIQPYIIGDDLNNRYDQSPSRWVINFKDWAYSQEDDNVENPKGPPYAVDFRDCLDILEQTVKPVRTRLNKDGNFALRDPMPRLWWIHGEKRPTLYKKVALLSRVLVKARVSKTHAFVFCPNTYVYSDATAVIAVEDYGSFSIIQSSFHELWSRQFASSMKADMRYTPSDCFQTFPFPQQLTSDFETILVNTGDLYYAERQALTIELKLGLTDLYNLFHTPNLAPAKLAKASKLLDPAQVQVLFDRLLNLRELHRQMDEAVSTAYGWSDLALEHGFHEQENLPEDDRVRYTISPAARREVLRRLLQLNHEIHAREVAEQAALALVTKATKPARKSKTGTAPHLALTITAEPLEITPAKPAVAKPAKVIDFSDIFPDEELATATPVVASPRPPRRAAPFERTVLGGEVIHQLYGSPGFGHVKLMKAMVLLDLHVLPEVDLDTHYYRQAAGPYDNALIRSLDSQFAQQKWYKAVPIPGGGARYERLPKAGSHQKYFPGYWAPHQPEINRVLELLRPLSMRQSEIVATLYVAWNDLLLDGQATPPDARIIEESTTAWNESKMSISTEEWAWGFHFMRQNDLVPRGKGQHSRTSPAKRG
jgi:hypothetical protein